MNEVTIFGRNSGHISAKQQVVSISSGDRHCLIGCLKKVYSIGANDWGQLGLGHNDAVTGIQRVDLTLPENVDIKQVSAGRDHSIILLSNGDVYGFGANNEDQLGEKDSFSPIKIKFDQRIGKIGCGSSFTIALDENGNLFGLGSNEDGQLGMGDVESFSTPTKLISLVKSFSCGYHHLAIITYDGKVLTTGDNDYGQLGRDGDQKKFLEVIINEELFVPRLVSCGGQVTFICGEGTSIYAAGTGDRGQLGTGPRQTSSNSFIPLNVLTRFASISSGFSSSSALCETTKRVFVWGSSKNGVLGSINQNLYHPTPLKNLTYCTARLVSTGGWNTVACHGEKEQENISDENVDFGARARRRAQRTLTASLPPLSQTLENSELSELRSVIRSQSLKRSTEFQLCNEADLKQYERVSISIDTTVTESVDLKKDNIIEEVDEEESEYETETDTDDEPIEAGVTVEPVKEEIDKSTVEFHKEESPNTIKDAQLVDENKDKNPTKHVQIDENKNDEKTYSEWGEDTQVPVFKSLRKSFRKIFKSDKTNKQSDKTETNDQKVANEPEISTDDVVAPKPDDKKKKSKLCTIL